MDMKLYVKFGILWLSWIFCGGLLALFFKWLVYQGCGYVLKATDFGLTCFSCYVVTFLLGLLVTQILFDEED